MAKHLDGQCGPSKEVHTATACCSKAMFLDSKCHYLRHPAQLWLTDPPCHGPLQIHRATNYTWNLSVGSQRAQRLSASWGLPKKWRIHHVCSGMNRVPICGSYHPKPPATCCLKSWIPIIFHQSLSFSILIVDFTTLSIEISFLPKLAPLRLMGRFSFTCHGLGAVARVPLGNQRWCSRHLWRRPSEAGWVFFFSPHDFECPVAINISHLLSTYCLNGEECFMCTFGCSKSLTTRHYGQGSIFFG